MSYQYESNDELMATDDVASVSPVLHSEYRVSEVELVGVNLDDILDGPIPSQNETTSNPCQLEIEHPTSISTNCKLKKENDEDGDFLIFF